jgi:hypothetical protein
LLLPPLGFGIENIGAKNKLLKRIQEIEGVLDEQNQRQRQKER